MKRFIFLLAIGLLTLSVQASDLIITKDAHRIDCKVVEMNDETIKYVDENGDSWEFPTHDTYLVAYENGTVVSFDEQKKHEITFEKSKPYFLNQPLTKQELDLLLSSCPTAHDLYNNGKTLYTAGWCMFGTGFVLAIPGFVLSRWGTKVTSNLGYLFVGTAIASVITSVPLLIVGNNRRQEGVMLFNQQCAPIELSLQVKSDGVGLALNF